MVKINNQFKILKNYSLLDFQLNTFENVYPHVPSLYHDDSCAYLLIRIFYIINIFFLSLQFITKIK